LSSSLERLISWLISTKSTIIDNVQRGLQKRCVNFHCMTDFAVGLEEAED